MLKKYGRWRRMLADFGELLANAESMRVNDGTFRTFVPVRIPQPIPRYESENTGPVDLTVQWVDSIYRGLRGALANSRS